MLILPLLNAPSSDNNNDLLIPVWHINITHTFISSLQEQPITSEATAAETNSHKKRLDHKKQFGAADDRHCVQLDTTKKIGVRLVTVQRLADLHTKHMTQ